MVEAVLREIEPPVAPGRERRPFEVDPVDHRRAALVRRELWRAPPRPMAARGVDRETGFEWAWTALVLGALAGAPLAMLLGAVLSLLLPSSLFFYLEMTSVFLVGWTLATLACLATRRLRVQWEIALWLGAVALVALAGCYLAVPRGDAVAAVDLGLALLLVVIARLLPRWLPGR